MKLIIGLGVGVAITIIAHIAQKNIRNVEPATNLHAVMVYDGQNYSCNLPSNHKSQHRTVLPKGWDPYFQEYYWD